MNKKWDNLDEWKSGAAMSSPGIGQREIEWPAYGGTQPFGGANPTCSTCGGRLRGAKKCTCDEPEWVVDGESVGDGGNDISLDNIHSQQAWHMNWLKEAFRVLKSGGIIKSFGGTRTFHRLAAAMEQAGFVDIRMDAWVYGCLSEDTEILTRQGWVTYTKNLVGAEVLGFDPQKNSITGSNDLSWQKVQEVYDYPYDDIAYHIIGDVTDQIVSKQHRCILSENNEWVVVHSDDLPSTGIFPYLELGGSGIRVDCSRAAVEQIHYKGTVWCVKVPTGAFVARRNGKAFITGNSGFPKSRNIWGQDLKPKLENALRAAGYQGEIKWK